MKPIRLVLLLSAGVVWAPYCSAGDISVVHIAPYTARATLPASPVATEPSGVFVRPAQVAVSTPSGEAFTLEAGSSVQVQLQTWAKRADWTVVWNSPDDWIVPASASYGIDFAAAAQRVLDQLAKNGADIRADIYTGNHTVVVTQAGASQ